MAWESVFKKKNEVALVENEVKGFLSRKRIIILFEGTKCF
jgi:hypothetical protein